MRELRARLRKGTGLGNVKVEGRDCRVREYVREGNEEDLRHGIILGRVHM